MMAGDPSDPGLDLKSGDLRAPAPSSKEGLTKSDMQLFKQAQQAMKAATRGERLQAPAENSKVSISSISSISSMGSRAPGAKKTSKPFDEKTRETAVQRAVSLMRTMTEYYGVTVGELEDEEKRLRTLSDDRLRGTLRAYEFTSRHVGVILVDEKAREVAINLNPEIASFYAKHGASEDEINQLPQTSCETVQTSQTRNSRNKLS